MTDREESERQRQQVLRYLYEQDQVASSRYWNADEIAQSTSLSIRDVHYHLDILGEGDYADVLKTGGEHYAAMIKPAGARLYREGVESHRFGVTTNIGAIINEVSGGNVLAVGSTVNSRVSQVVNEPGQLRAALDELGQKLLEAVREELQERDLEDYTRAIDDLKGELSERRDSGRVRKLLRTLALFGDIEGSMGLMVRLWPLVGAATALAQGLGIN